MVNSASSAACPTVDPWHRLSVSQKSEKSVWICEESAIESFFETIAQTQSFTWRDEIGRYPFAKLASTACIQSVHQFTLLDMHFTSRLNFKRLCG